MARKTVDSPGKGQKRRISQTVSQAWVRKRSKGLKDRERFALVIAAWRRSSRLL